MRKMGLFHIGWILFLAAQAAQATTFDFRLTRSPQSVGSWYRPSDTASKSYDPGTVLTLELPSSDGTLAGVQSGVARITNFSLPAAINNFGLYFRFTSVPTPIVGTVTVSGDQAEIAFPTLAVGFERGSNLANASPGTLLFTLTTAGTTIPGGCADRPPGGQFMPGIPLNLVNGQLGLVASVCPYSTLHADYDNAFRLAVRGAVPVPECLDELDNDGDGFTDFAGGDPGCADAEDWTEKDPSLPCDDGLDNDGDGLFDYPADPGCDDPVDASERSPLLECDDGVDNDGDGLADVVEDPGCEFASDLSEHSPLLTCDDGADNDGDGLADYPADPGCDGLLDGSENKASLVCDDGVDNDGDGYVDYPADAGCTALLDNSEKSASLVCDDGVDNDGDGLSDVPDDPGCDDPGDPSERSPLLACDDGVDTDGDGLSDFPDDPGCDDPGDTSEHSPSLICDDGADNDGDSLSDYPGDPGCDGVGDPSERSPALVCDDGADNDGDGLADIPDDPGCDAPADSSERSPLLACDDGVDTDGDGLSDFPDDPGCDAPGDTSEHSPSLICDDGVDNDGDGLSDYPGDPGCDDVGDASERSPALVCDDGADNDGDGLSDVPDDPGCDDPSDASERSPALVCDDGSDNDGDGLSDVPDDPGCDDVSDASERSPLLVCDDAADNDGDGLSDIPDDPGCDSAFDASETSPLLVCDDGLDNDADGLTDFPDDPECGSPLDSSESLPPVPLSKDQQACVNEMNKNGAKVNKAQLKQGEKCLKDFQRGKLTTSFEVCTSADPKEKVQKAVDKTVSGDEKKCAPLAPDELPPFAYTAPATVNQAAVARGLALVHEIFGDPVQDGDLATKAAEKEKASCQYTLLKQAGKLEAAVVKEVNKAKKTALKDPVVTGDAALEAALAVVFDPANAKLGKAAEKLEKGVEKKCGSLLASPATIFPGACADPDLQVVEGCAIAAARCQACSKINAFDGLSLDCDQLDDASINASCP